MISRYSLSADLFLRALMPFPVIIVEALEARRDFLEKCLTHLYERAQTRLQTSGDDKQHLKGSATEDGERVLAATAELLVLLVFLIYSRS